MSGRKKRYQNIFTPNYSFLSHDHWLIIWWAVYQELEIDNKRAHAAVIFSLPYFSPMIQEQIYVHAQIHSVCLYLPWHEHRLCRVWMSCPVSLHYVPMTVFLSVSGHFWILVNVFSLEPRPRNSLVLFFCRLVLWGLVQFSTGIW